MPMSVANKHVTCYMFHVSDNDLTKKQQGHPGRCCSTNIGFEKNYERLNNDAHFAAI